MKTGWVSLTEGYSSKKSTLPQDSKKILFYPLWGFLIKRIYTGLSLCKICFYPWYHFKKSLLSQFMNILDFSWVLFFFFCNFLESFKNITILVERTFKNITNAKVAICDVSNFL
jgi:hypothetical protein